MRLLVSDGVVHELIPYPISNDRTREMLSQGIRSEYDENYMEVDTHDGKEALIHGYFLDVSDLMDEDTAYSIAAMNLITDDVIVHKGSCLYISGPKPVDEMNRDNTLTMGREEKVCIPVTTPSGIVLGIPRAGIRTLYFGEHELYRKYNKDTKVLYEDSYSYCYEMYHTDHKDIEEVLDPEAIYNVEIRECRVGYEIKGAFGREKGHTVKGIIPRVLGKTAKEVYDVISKYIV